MEEGLQLSDKIYFFSLSIPYFFCIFMSFKYRGETSKKKVVVLNVFCLAYGTVLIFLRKNFITAPIEYTYDFFKFLTGKIYILSVRGWGDMVAAFFTYITFFVLPFYFVNKFFKKIYTTMSIIFACIAPPLLAYFITMLALAYGVIT